MPEAHDTARHRYWHFGWPVSDEAVNEIIDRYTPDYLDEDQDVTDKYPHFNDLIEGLSGLKPIRLVLVAPTCLVAEPARFPWQEGRHLHDDSVGLWWAFLQEAAYA